MELRLQRLGRLLASLLSKVVGGVLRFNRLKDLHMKKIILFGLIVLVFIPSLVSAVWWNPLSWSIFHKKKIEIPVEIPIEKPVIVPEVVSPKKKETTKPVIRKAKTSSFNEVQQVQKQVETVTPQVDYKAECLKQGTEQLTEILREKNANKDQYDGLSFQNQQIMANMDLQNISDLFWQVQVICGAVTTEEQMLHELQGIKRSLQN